MDSKIQKFQTRLEEALESKNYYEAHQICRIIYNRYLKVNQHDELLKFLYEYCIVFVDAKEFNIALDVTQLLVGIVRKTRTQIGEEFIAQLKGMFSKIPDEYLANSSLSKQLDDLNDIVLASSRENELIDRNNCQTPKQEAVEMDLD